MTTANLLKLGKTKSCGCLRKEKYKPSKIRWFSVLVDPAETGLYLTFGDSVEISLMVFQTGFGWFPTDAKISHWAYINLPE